jgi:hypothetical protein
MLIFFSAYFSHFFQRFLNQLEILSFFDTFSDFYFQQFLMVILALFANFEAKRSQSGSKN